MRFAPAAPAAMDAWTPPPPVDEAAVLARVKERQALHELIRLGFSRVEDLKLLQGVVDGRGGALDLCLVCLLRDVCNMCDVCDVMCVVCVTCVKRVSCV